MDSENKKLLNEIQSSVNESESVLTKEDVIKNHKKLLKTGEGLYIIR